MFAQNYTYHSFITLICTGKDALLLLESLKTLITPEEKLDMVMRKYAELVRVRFNKQSTHPLLSHHSLNNPSFTTV